MTPTDTEWCDVVHSKMTCNGLRSNDARSDYVNWITVRWRILIHGKLTYTYEQTAHDLKSYIIARLNDIYWNADRLCRNNSLDAGQAVYSVIVTKKHRTVIYRSTLSLTEQVWRIAAIIHYKSQFTGEWLFSLEECNIIDGRHTIDAVYDPVRHLRHVFHQSCQLFFLHPHFKQIFEETCEFRSEQFLHDICPKSS